MVSFSILMGIFSCLHEDDPMDIARRHFKKRLPAVQTYVESLSVQDRSFIILQLAEEHPMRIGPLCALLEDVPAQQRCTKIAQRPHLWTPSPSSSNRPKGDCIHPHLCIQQDALVMLKEGNVLEAEKKCRTIDELKWSQECLFHLAETHIAADKQNLHTSTHMCIALDIFRLECIQHIIFEYAQHLLTEDFVSMQPFIEDFRMLWQNIDPYQVELRQHQLWARWMDLKFDQHKLIPQDIPIERLPDYHSSYALWAVRNAHPLPKNLESLVHDLIKGNLNTRKKARGLEPMFNLWEGGTHNTRSFLGYSVRLFDEDPNIDLLLALLESVARLRPPKKELLQPYLEHAHPKVKSTAKRLYNVDYSRPERLLKPVKK